MIKQILSDIKFGKKLVAELEYELKGLKDKFDAYRKHIKSAVDVVKDAMPLSSKIRNKTLLLTKSVITVKDITSLDKLVDDYVRVVNNIKDAGKEIDDRLGNISSDLQSIYHKGEKAYIHISTLNILLTHSSHNLSGDISKYYNELISKEHAVARIIREAKTVEDSIRDERKSLNDYGKTIEALEKDVIYRDRITKKIHEGNESTRVILNQRDKDLRDKSKVLDNRGHILNIRDEAQDKKEKDLNGQALTVANDQHKLGVDIQGSKKNNERIIDNIKKQLDKLSKEKIKVYKLEENLVTKTSAYNEKMKVYEKTKKRLNEVKAHMRQLIKDYNIKELKKYQKELKDD